MVEFQTAIREHRLSGSLRSIIHGQQENINPPMPTTVAQKEMATATVATKIIKTECISTLSGPIRRVMPILIKEEPSEVHIIQDTDALKHELPSVPEHLFNQVKREVDDPANSYSEYETDDSQYLADDVKIVTETDSNDADELVDNTLTSYSIETLDAALMKIRDGLSIAAMGYKEIRQALPNINPIEVPQIMEQVPLPQIEGISRNMKTLLEKMPEENIIKKTTFYIWLKKESQFSEHPKRQAYHIMLFMR